MSSNSVKISKISNKITSKNEDNYYSVCLLQSDIHTIKIDDTTYNNVSNSMFFLLPRNHWKITKKKHLNNLWLCALSSKASFR